MALIAHLTPLALACVVYSQIGGDDMTKPLGQFFVIYLTAAFALLAFIDPIWAYLLFRSKRASAPTSDDALMRAATAAALPPMLLMGLVFVLLVCGRLLAQAEGSP
jgi:hypothetical protein